MDRLSVRALRLAREITQEQLANDIGVHVNTYISWEKEPEKIPIGKAYLICKLLNADIESVIFCSESLQNVE